MNRNPIGKQIRVQVLARDEYRCKMCGRTKDEVSLEVDHIISVAAGGTDEMSNLATLCRDCNRGKSSYRFKDYTYMDIIPENVEKHIKFAHDGKQGDFEQYHLYLYYRDGIHPGPTNRSFHHSWRISGSVYDSSSNCNVLETNRKNEEIKVFLKKIKTELIADGKQLVDTEEGLCKV